jgi:hypothetical protein
MKKLLSSFAVLICMFSLQARAQIDGTGYDHGNGGDICEQRFHEVAEDLRSWIADGGAENLDFPVTISYGNYRQSMLDKINAAQVSCVDEYVFIGAAEKTCINFTDAKGALRIQCNKERFMTTSQNDQYVLVHHEYAGLAGFETNNGEASSYVLSKQLGAYLNDQIIRKVIVKGPPDFNDPFDSASCTDPNMSSEETFTKFSGGGTAAVAVFRVYTRERWCNNPGGCGNWEKIPNQITYSDRNGARKYMMIPDNGVINYLMPSYMDSIVTLTTTQEWGMGLSLACQPGGEETVCSIVSTPFMQSLGEARGTIGAHCLRLRFHDGFYADKAFFESKYIFKYGDGLIPNAPWIDRETVILSRY